MFREKVLLRSIAQHHLFLAKVYWFHDWPYAIIGENMFVSLELDGTTDRNQYIWTLSNKNGKLEKWVDNRTK